MAKNMIAENKNKQEARRRKAAAKERLTNWYMINMTWGFLAVVLLHQIVLRGYTQMGMWAAEHSPATNITLWSFALLFTLGGGALLWLWKGCSICKKCGSESFWCKFRGNGKSFGAAIFAWIVAVTILLFTLAPQLNALFWTNDWGVTRQPIITLVMLIFGVFFALSGVALFFFWIRGKKEKSRLFSYSIFAWVIALVMFIIAFNSQILNMFSGWEFMKNLLQPNPHNMIYGLMIGIGLWLVVALVIYIVKARKIK